MKNLLFLNAGVPLTLSPLSWIARGRNGGSRRNIPLPLGVHALILKISETFGAQDIQPAELEKEEMTFEQSRNAYSMLNISLIKTSHQSY